jgi:hypothetical protein
MVAWMNVDLTEEGDRADGSTRLPLASEANSRIGLLVEAKHMHFG